MRIAIWHNLPSGGGKRALYNHIKALVKAGYELEAWTTDMASEDYLPLTDLVKENRLPLKEEYFKISRIQSPLAREQRLIKLLENHALDCAEEIEKKGFDMIFANSCSYSYMPYIGKFTTLPVFVYLGEPFRPLYEAAPVNCWQAHYDTLRLKKIKRLFFDYRTNYALRLRVKKEIEAAKSYDKILVNSLFSRENVRRAYGIDARVCYLGLDDTAFIDYPVAKKGFIIGMGSISWNKGIERAINIVASLPENIRPPLKWIANFADSQYYDDMVKLAANKKVIFQALINIPDSELKRTLAEASLMLYTSILEPFGLAPLEANACGTYVVGIAEGGIRESIKNGVNGSLVLHEDPTYYTDLITDFLANPAHAKEMGEKAKNYVHEKWNSDFMSNNLLENLSKIRGKKQQ